MTRVKICGITNLRDAQLAVEFGAHALGFVLEPSSPRCVRDARFVEGLLADLPPYVFTVAVFGPPPTIQLPRGIHAVQCSGTMASGRDRTLKTIHAVRVRPGESPEDAVGHAADADAVLLDAFDPNAYGGTGKTVDWDLAAELRKTLAPQPVVLAGGLNSDNVAKAIEKVRPFAVDVSGGVEAMPGAKDPDKIKRFLEAVRDADLSLSR